MLRLSTIAYKSIGLSGGGGSGELAWRFSGFGELGLAVELVTLDDEADLIENTMNNYKQRRNFSPNYKINEKLMKHIII